MSMKINLCGDLSAGENDKGGKVISLSFDDLF